MKINSLEFLDKEVEVKYQDKQNKDRLTLLRLYLLIKVTLAIIEISYHQSQHDKIEKFTQGFLSITSFTSYLIILMHRSTKVSYMVNFMQVAQPVIIICISGALKRSIPTDNLFMYGGFKLVNMATLYLMGTNYISNSICFMFSSILVTYTYYPDIFSYNLTNFIAIIIWLIVIKYISDRDRRNQFLLKMKDEYWTHIMKGRGYYNLFLDMIDDWVVMVNFNLKKDQITVRDANQNFQTSCKVFDDKSFRTFVRSIHVQSSNDTQFKFDQNQGQNIIQNLRESLDQTHDHDIQINKHPDLEFILRQHLLQHDSILSQQKDKQRSSFIWKQESDNLKVMKFVGLRLDQAKRKYTVYQMRMIKGSDKEPFILLIIKKLKNQDITKQSNSQVLKQNLVKMSDICIQYLKITELIYNNVKIPSIMNHEEVSSSILSLSNRHYVHQLYLNQMHDVEQFKFQTIVSSINIHQMIQFLQLKMKNKIHIHLNKNTSQNLIIDSFQRELTHIFLIFIENSIKHCKQTPTKVYIDILEHDEEVVKFQIKDYGPGISKSSITDYLDSYKISLAREKKRITILDHQQYNIHLRSKMRHGWIAARMILSILGPNNSFVVSSDVGHGCIITFTIYKNVQSLVKLSNSYNT